MDVYYARFHLLSMQKSAMPISYKSKKKQY